MNEKIQKTINQLKAISLVGSSHENLSALCSVLYKPDYGWTIGACSMLRDVLVGMLEQLDPDEWADEYLDEVGLVRLPKDVDGVPVHVGDRMVLADGDEPFEVEAIGGNILWFYDEDLQEHHNWESYECRHYKPTLKEALSEVLIGFGAKWDEVGSGYERELAEDYADAILRIVEGSNDE